MARSPSPARRELEVSARLARPTPGKLPPEYALVSFDSNPPGAAVRVDRKVLGTTPTKIRFKVGVTFEVTFVHPERESLVRWMTVAHRNGRPTRVTLQPPPEKR